MDGRNLKSSSIKRNFSLFLFLFVGFWFIFTGSVKAVSQEQACIGSGCSLRCGICIGNNNCALNQPAVSNNPAPGYTHFCTTNSDCTNVFQGVPSPGTTFYGSVKRCGQQVAFGTPLLISNCGYVPSFTVKSSAPALVNGVYSVYSFTTNTDSIGNWLRDGSLNGETVNFYIKDPILGNLTWLGRYTFNTSESNKQLNWDYCPSVPTPTVTPQPTPACNLISQEAGSLKYTINNTWQFYVPFIPTVSGNLTKAAIKAGNWGNAQRSLTCRITDNSGAPITSERSSASFTAGSGALWREIDFKTASVSLQKSLTYRLYCKGSDSWGSLFWIYNQQGNPNSKTFRITLCAN